MDFIGLYRTFHSNTAGYTFFARAHWTFSRIDHILEHKTILNKFKKIECISNFFSDCNGKKLEVNYKKKGGKPQICGEKQHATE